MKPSRLPLLLMVPVVFIFGRPPNTEASIFDDIPTAMTRTLDSASAAPPLPGKPIDVEALRFFYQQRGNQPIWVDEAGATERAQALLRALQNADRDGLDPTDYDLAPLLRDLGTTDRVAMAELTVSSTLLRYASDLHGGRALPARIGRDPRIVSVIDPVQTLTAAADAPDPTTFLNALSPVDSVYTGLRDTLARYRAIGAAGGWPQLPEGPELGPGSVDPAVRALRLRLQLTGDLAPDAQGDTPSRYDENVRDAVRRFQHRHGLPENGVVGAQTRAALNIPVQDRIRQIRANLDRARWLPDDLGNTYVFVNLADFHLEVVEGGLEILRMRVVVGDPQTLTPVFSDKISYIEVNPYWNVPKSIAIKEKLGVLRRNPGALRAQNIRVFGPGGEEIGPGSVNWWAVNAGNWHYRLRQDPGPRNALGRIKFMFPNPYDIYLHDTPSRALFRRQVRAFSHGCIRVEKPIELATLLLRDNEGYGRSRIERLIAKGANRPILLTNPVPVHIAYLTTWVGRDGVVHFRSDHYSLDASVIAAVSAGRE